MNALQVGSVVWYVTGRFYLAEDGALQDLGYFLHFAGLEGSLFDGEGQSEATACLTFRSEPFQASNVVNGPLVVSLDPVGSFSVYLKRRPGSSFDHPDSFSDGMCIATFRRASVVAGAKLEAGSQKQAGALSLNVFTATLTWSREFIFRGRTYDLGRLIPNGITQWGDAGPTPITPTPTGFSSVVPFLGSAIAVGG